MAFAREGDEVIVATVIATGAGKAMQEDIVFEVFTKGLADIGLECVVLTLPVELACANQFKPSLEVVGYGLVKQPALMRAWYWASSLA
jgi:hypothetical protein